jgi:hypothetical protein
MRIHGTVITPGLPTAGGAVFAREALAAAVRDYNARFEFTSGGEVRGPDGQVIPGLRASLDLDADGRLRAVVLHRDPGPGGA